MVNEEIIGGNGGSEASVLSIHVNHVYIYMFGMKFLRRNSIVCILCPELMKFLLKYYLVGQPSLLEACISPSSLCPLIWVQRSTSSVGIFQVEASSKKK